MEPDKPASNVKHIYKISTCFPHLSSTTKTKIECVAFRVWFCSLSLSHKQFVSIKKGVSTKSIVKIKKHCLRSSFFCRPDMKHTLIRGNPGYILFLNYPWILYKFSVIHSRLGCEMLRFLSPSTSPLSHVE